MDEEFDGGETECSYCGKSIYADSPRCPKCGNYTDGLGPLARSTRGGRPIPRKYIIAGWIVIGCMLAPIIIALLQWLKRR